MTDEASKVINAPLPMTLNKVRLFCMIVPPYSFRSANRQNDLKQTLAAAKVSPAQPLVLSIAVRRGLIRTEAATRMVVIEGLGPCVLNAPRPQLCAVAMELASDCHQGQLRFFFWRTEGWAITGAARSARLLGYHIVSRRMHQIADSANGRPWWELFSRNDATIARKWYWGGREADAVFAPKWGMDGAGDAQSKSLLAQLWAENAFLRALLTVSTFAGIDEQALDRIEARSRQIEYQDGALIFAQGDLADAVYAIVGGEGRVRIGAIGRGSKGLMVEMFHAGDIFGEIAVIDGDVRSADAVAEGRVRTLRIGTTVFLAALAEHPALGTNLCRLLATRLRWTSTLLQDATFEGVEVRLARQVLYLAKLDGRPTEQGIRLAGRFRQNDLADLLGTTTRSIITILNAWRASGLVIYDVNRAHLTLVDEAGLTALINSNANK
jgi:CRP-like cAMP-binding protein